MIGKVIVDKRKYTFRKPCIKCGETFQPKTKFSRLCPKCHTESLAHNKQNKNKQNKQNTQNEKQNN